MKHHIAAIVGFTLGLASIAASPGEAWSPAKVARVGVLYGFGGSTTTERFMKFSEPFRRRLAVEGWVEGKNVSIEYRGAPIDPSQLDKAAADLIRMNVDVIYAPDAPSVRAAFAATRTIPIVAADATTDPIAEGYIASYGRPGGNLTGVFLDAPELASKWLELLRSIVPSASHAVALWDPAPGHVHLEAVQAAARALRVQLQVVEARNPEEIDRGLSSLHRRGAVVIILPSPLMYVQSKRLAMLTTKQRLPAASMFRLFAEAGGLISYGHEMASMNERCAVLVARILRGESPSELPVERPSKFELLVNLHTAAVLGLTIPESVRVQADKLIR